MRVLIVEYLHAQSEAFQLASDSMRSEGRMMLTAMVEDLNRLDGVTSYVALCAAAEANVGKNNSNVLSVSNSPESDFDERLLAACAEQTFDNVLLVAPECGGLLARITRRLRHQNFNVAVPSIPAITLCADKLSTTQFLQRQRIGCIASRPLTQFARLQIPNNESVVIKPRDGAGCEEVVRMKSEALQSEMLQLGLPDSTHHNRSASYLDRGEDFIVQPFVDGISYSVGMIGRGEATGPLILPVAHQNIEWSNDRPTYCGGTIPAETVEMMKETMTSIASQIATALNVTCGYVGLDFLVDTATQQIFVNEINPRLCTSYEGYRRLTSTNLIAVMLQLEPASSIEWAATPVPFRV